MTEKEAAPPSLPSASSSRSRRDFLRTAGLAGATLVIPAVLAACAESANTAPLSASRTKGADGPSYQRPGTIVLDFKDDIGVLNYAYALEQLEAAFYLQVVATPYVGITDRELRLLTDIKDHEVVHREFLKAGLGHLRIPDVVPDFSSINFADRASVLGTAKAFEDLGVGAYNGAARYISDTDYLVVAGKIVSVEARHASAIGDLITPRSGSFAPHSFDPAFDPKSVISGASSFITTKIVVVNS